MLASRKQLYLLGLFSPAFLTLLYYTRYERSGGKILWVPNFDGTVRDILWASPDPNDPIPLYWRDWIERVPVFTMATVVLTTANSSPWTVDPTWNAANNSVELIGAGGNGTNGTTGSNSSGGGGGGAGSYTKLTNGAISGTVTFKIGTAGGGGGANVTNASCWENNTSTNCYVATSGSNASGTTGGTGGSVSSSSQGSPPTAFTIAINCNVSVGGDGSGSGTNRGGGGGGGTGGPLAAGGVGGST